MDKIKMHNSTFGLFNEDDKWYTDLVKETLILARDKNVVVEINTKAFKRANLLYPGPEFFAFIKDHNIPVTINSDAHMTKFLTLGYEEVAERLLAAGISNLYEWEQGQWLPRSFTLKGVLI